VSFFLFRGRASAQFIDDFNGPSVQIDPDGTKGWMFLAGDGTATMNFRRGGEGLRLDFCGRNNGQARDLVGFDRAKGLRQGGFEFNAETRS